jgi:hypothetical protein
MAQALEQNHWIAQTLQQWLAHILRALREFNQAMWQHWNEVLQKNVLCSLQIGGSSSINDKIQQLYAAQEIFLEMDQQIFDLMLDCHLLMSAWSKNKHWVCLAEQYKKVTKE